MGNKMKRIKVMCEKVVLGHRDGSAHLKGLPPSLGSSLCLPFPRQDAQGKRRESVTVSFTPSSDSLQAPWHASPPSPDVKRRKW